MTTNRMLLTAAAAVALLVALAIGGSDFEPGHAFTKGGGGGAGAGAAGSGGAAGSAGAGSASAGAAGTDGSQGDGGSDEGRSLAAFVASPVYGRVASEEPPTEEAGPVVSRLGAQCRTLTQTIDIGGQTVPASGVVCRQPDGTWRLNETQSARLVSASAGNEPSALTKRAASRGRHCVRGGAVPCAASGLPRRLRVIAARPRMPAESTTERPNR
jgi:surface antigen